MILVIVGLPGSGKSTAAEMLREEGFDVIEFGDIWRELLKEAGLPLNDPKATREFTKELREKHGKDIYAKYAVKRIKKSMKHIVITGLRSTYELNYLKKRVKEIKILAMLSPQMIRFGRLKIRHKPEDPRSLADFKWLEVREKRGFLTGKKEEKHGVMILIHEADYHLHNTGTKTDLKRNLDNLISHIKSKDDWQNVSQK